MSRAFSAQKGAKMFSKTFSSHLDGFVNVIVHASAGVGL